MKYFPQLELFGSCSPCSTTSFVLGDLDKLLDQQYAVFAIPQMIVCVTSLVPGFFSGKKQLGFRSLGELFSAQRFAIKNTRAFKNSPRDLKATKEPCDALYWTLDHVAHCRIIEVSFVSLM